MEHLQEAVIRGTVFHYRDAGRGVPVVFVHDAVSDYRYWRAQYQVISTKTRCLVFDQQYFGSWDWPHDGPQYSVATHSEDRLTEQQRWDEIFSFDNLIHPEFEK